MFLQQLGFKEVNLQNLASTCSDKFCGPDGAENWVRKSMAATLWQKTIKPTGVPVTDLGALNF